MHTVIRRAVQIFCVIWLTACGGGGGSPSDGDPEPPAPSPQPPPQPTTFVLGGAVSGLQGAGLVLRNGSDDLAISASGPFQFATRLADGANYAVTVLTQPTQPAQICTVNGSQGQVSGADVSTITVECRTSFEFLSSTPADGLNEVSRSVQPTLTFSASLATGSVTSSVAALTSPAGPETFSIQSSGAVLSVIPTRPLLPLTDYTLEVADTLLSEDGATLAAPVRVRFRTREAAWGTQNALTGTDASAGGLNVNGTRIVADVDGRATVVWSNEVGALMKRELWARHRPIGGDWEAAIRIDESDLEDVGDLDMASDDAGGVLVVWAQTQGSIAGDYNRIFSRRFTPGGGWEPAQLVTQTGSDLTQLQVSMHADGTAMLIWYQAAPGSVSIVAARYLSGSGWEAPQRVDTATSVVFRPQVAMSDAGAAVAVWEQYIQGAGNDIFAAHFDAASGWRTPERVSVNNTGVAIGPSLAAAANGEAIVTWQQSAGLVRYTAASRYIASQGWNAPVRVENGAGSSDQAQVIVDRQGFALAVWRQAISGVIHVHSSRHDPAGGMWSPPQAISNIVGNAAVFNPRLAFDRRGNALAAWYELDPTTADYRVRGNRFTPENGWGGAEDIGSPDQMVWPFSVDLAIDGAGSGWAVWAQNDSNDTPRVLVNRFE